MKKEFLIATVKGIFGEVPFGGLISEYMGLISDNKQQKILDGMNDRLKCIETEYETFKNEVVEKLILIPDDKFIIPPLNIIMPIVETSKFYIEDCRIREMFSELISKSMNADTTNSVHVSFSEIIKQLSSFDARFLKKIAIQSLSKLLGNSFLPFGAPYVVTDLVKNETQSNFITNTHLCDRSKKNFFAEEKKSSTYQEHENYLDKLSISLDNLLRLNLIEVIEMPQLLKDFEFVGYTKEFVERLQERIKGDSLNSHRYKIIHRFHFVKLTDFGFSFCNAVRDNSDDLSDSDNIMEIVEIKQEAIKFEKS